MKNREYYERLISDSLDRMLSAAEAEELEQGMREYPGLAEFRATTLKQAELIRSLPELKVYSALKPSFAKLEKRGILWSLWNIRVSLPLPVAALVLLAVLSSVLFGIYAKKALSVAATVRQTTRIEYIQIERLKPAKAILIQQNQDESQSGKESL